jgi:hypothetical protein
MSVSEDSGVEPAVVGQAAFDRGVPSLKVGVRLLAEDVRFDILPPAPGAGSRIDLRYSDIVSVLWTSSWAGFVQRADVLLTSRSQDPVRLQLSCRWYSSEIKRLMRGLLASLPHDALLVEEGRAIPIRPIAAVVAALAVLGAAGLGAVRYELGDRPIGSGTGSPASTGGEARTASAQVREAPAASPGYLRLAGLGGWPPAVGRPWGRACLTEELVLNGEVPQTVVTATHDVLAGAQQAMTLSVSLPSKRTWTGFTAHGPGGGLPDPMDTSAPINFPVVQYRQAPSRPSGTSGGDSVAFWKTLPAGSSGDQRFDWFQGNLFPDSLMKDPLRLRKALRMMLANSVGIAYSERPGSGLRGNLDDSIDGFSTDDLHALEVFSGC